MENLSIQADLENEKEKNQVAKQELEKLKADLQKLKV